MTLEVFMPAPRKPKAKRAAPKSAAQAVSLADALGEAAWVEADRALAQAMAEIEEVEAASNQVRRAEALMLLRQALARAARVRGFARLGGEPGSVEAYDPRRHDLLNAPKTPPAEVTILAQGVARGEVVLVKARVRAVRKRPAT
jgi:hypothetical protein